MGTSNRETLVNAIYAALVQDARVNLVVSQLDIHVSGGKLVLDGTVENIPSKRIATNLASQMAGAQYHVEDRLRVSTDAVPDSVLRDKIAEVLTGEPVFSSYNILVEAGGQRGTLRDLGTAAGTLWIGLHDGVVTLDGEVESLTHSRLAEVLIWWIPGCQRVDNRIQVVPPERDTDEELTDAVRIVLEKDPLVHASQVRVGTAAGVVELDGQLPSEDEHTLTLLDTWAVPGVWEVYDRIEVGRGVA